MVFMLLQRGENQAVGLPDDFQALSQQGGIAPNKAGCR